MFLTGHGGGRNFGAVGGLNLTRDDVARAVASAHFEKATIVLDFCWSGEFGKSFAEYRMPGPVTLVTSTDAHHPCPFPVSFLSPLSFGRMFFDQWSDSPSADLAVVNQRRQSLRRLYPESFGLVGETRTLTP